MRPYQKIKPRVLPLPQKTNSSEHCLCVALQHTYCLSPTQCTGKHLTLSPTPCDTSWLTSLAPVCQTSRFHQLS